MSAWSGRVVGYGTVKRDGKAESVVLVLEDGGDGLWRFEDELRKATPEEARKVLWPEKKESAGTSPSIC